MRSARRFEGASGLRKFAGPPGSAYEVLILDEVGVPVRSWGAYERGTSNPGAGARPRLAGLMAIEPAAGSWDGGELRARRLEAGLTKRQLARRVGITPETVCRWERGRTRPLAMRWKLLDEVQAD